MSAWRDNNNFQRSPPLRRERLLSTVTYNLRSLLYPETVTINNMGPSSLGMHMFFSYIYLYAVEHSGVPFLPICSGGRVPVKTCRRNKSAAWRSSAARPVCVRAAAALGLSEKW